MIEIPLKTIFLEVITNEKERRSMAYKTSN